MINKPCEGFLLKNNIKPNYLQSATINLRKVYTYFTLLSGMFGKLNYIIMDKLHFIKTIVRLWKTTTNEGRIKLVLSLFAIIVGSGGFGYWIGTIDMSHRLATLESKYERELTELVSKGVKYISEFSTDDWINIEGQGNQFRIPFSVHMVKNPIVVVQQQEENGNWKNVLCPIEIDEFNNVIIKVLWGFDGRVVLK